MVNVIYDYVAYNHASYKMYLSRWHEFCLTFCCDKCKMLPGTVWILCVLSAAFPTGSFSCTDILQPCAILHLQ